MAWAQIPTITLVANAEGENPVIAPNTWVEIKGSNLSKPGDSRIWQTPDFVNSQLPTSLDGVSVMVGGKSAYVYYISPTQIDILTPPGVLPGTAAVQVTNNGAVSPPFTVQAQTLSPSFFNLNGGPYVLAQHGADNSLIGPASFSVPGYAFTPAKPGETVVLYANGFGQTSTPVVAGSETQGGNLSPPPIVTIGGTNAQVTFAGLISPGLFQFNVVIPTNAPSGDNTITATYNGASVSPVGLITVQGSGASPTSVTLYVAPNGNDFWSGRLAAPNLTKTDGPFATFDRARTIVQQIQQIGTNAGERSVPRRDVFPTRNRDSHGGGFRLANHADRLSKLSRRIAHHQRRHPFAELDQLER